MNNKRIQMSTTKIHSTLTCRPLAVINEHHLIGFIYCGGCGKNLQGGNTQKSRQSILNPWSDCCWQFFFMLLMWAVLVGMCLGVAMFCILCRKMLCVFMLLLMVVYGYVIRFYIVSNPIHGKVRSIQCLTKGYIEWEFTCFTEEAVTGCDKCT